MDGSIARLDEICDLADRYQAMVHFDDCHATGFVGANGRGTHELRGCMDRVDIITGTLGKALGGGSGGYTSARSEVIELLRQRSRPYLFSNTVAPPVVAGAIKALELVSQSTELRDKLAANTAFFREGLQKLGFKLLGRRAPHRTNYVGRRGTGQPVCRSYAGAGCLCGSVFFSCGSQGQCAHPHSDVGGPQPG